MLSSIAVLTLALTFINTASADIFTVNASLPGNAFDGQVINAAGEAFWIGGSPATYCPTDVDPNCPNVTGTVLAAGFTEMDVEVPGGQQVYVAANGALGFTQAHSASVPLGAYIGGFINVTITSDCTAPWTVINWQSPNATTEGILACPVPPSTANGTVSYQIYAKTPAFNLTNCVTLDGMLPTYLPSGSPVGAWEYI